MPRYRIIVEYDGAPFAGWQVQPSERTVQGALVEAVKRMTRETVAVKGAGRTDTGVHATGQVAHFDLERAYAPEKIRDALNFHLRPNPIAILACEEAAPEFDARFSAIRRHYRYRILSRRPPPVLDRHAVWWVAYEMDHERMIEAARALVGIHDFTTFRASGCQAPSPIRSLEHIGITRSGDEIQVDVRARSFLHNQVRSMVGSLKLVGTGRWPVERVAAALAARDRTQCGGLAPPWGLCLTQVDYH
jgi:tRNA pseudouridine38-40 synthase